MPYIACKTINHTVKIKLRITPNLILFQLVYRNKNKKSSHIYLCVKDTVSVRGSKLLQTRQNQIINYRPNTGMNFKTIAL